LLPHSAPRAECSSVALGNQMALSQPSSSPALRASDPHGKGHGLVSPRRSFRGSRRLPLRCRRGMGDGPQPAPKHPPPRQGPLPFPPRRSTPSAPPNCNEPLPAPIAPAPRFLSQPRGISLSTLAHGGKTTYGAGGRGVDSRSESPPEQVLPATRFELPCVPFASWNGSGQDDRDSTSRSGPTAPGPWGPWLISPIEPVGDDVYD